MAALALMTLVAAAASPASADETPHAEKGKYCTQWESFYGQGGYTFTDARVCLGVNGLGMVTETVETDRNTYWHGSVWWSTTPGYPADVNADVTFGGQTRRGSWTQESRSAEKLVGHIVFDQCGLWTIGFRYYQVGGYYGGDKAINETRNYEIRIPCAWD
ncbi:hypothetical protein [Streptomyces sp. NPDC056154]|uniref:hypothetical protein n=1 Tax=unclassified Streptomyces TaxID=2593676 RepID=UPI0035E3618C